MCEFKLFESLLDGALETQITNFLTNVKTQQAALNLIINE